VSKNFVAGILMLLSQPFELGDAIEVAGYTGTVQAIELRATELKTFDGRQVLIPNGDVFSKPVTNFTRNNLRRLNVDVGIAYGSDLEKVRTTTLSAILALPGVLPDPAPQVMFNQFAESSINFTLFYWINQAETNYADMVDAGFITVENSLREAGISIPFPIRTVYLQEQTAHIN
jgi:small-conductance mechanosensitive channel